LSHLKSLALRAKSEIAEVATAVADAVEEIEAQKPDKSQEVSATIPANGWSADTNAYPKYYDLTAAGVTALDEVRVNLVPASVGSAVACGLCPTCETLAGKIRFRSLQVPASAISVKYRIQNGKE
jgi:hypothetical protein